MRANAPVVDAWFSPIGRARFRDEHLGRAPFAAPSVAHATTPFLDWAILDRVLAHDHVDVLVVAGGALLDEPIPRSADHVRALFVRGIGVAVRHAQRHDHGLRALADALTHVIPGRAQVQLFVTPGKTHGFAWHYDAEDVFIAQTIGTKTYYFRENTVAPNPREGGRFDFSRFRDERSPTLACTLVAGDFLYLPRGWWHCAKAHDDALSISIGLFPSLAGERDRRFGDHHSSPGTSPLTIDSTCARSRGR